MSAFIVNEIPSGGGFILGITDQFFTDFPDFVCETSYSILAARLLGMHYSDYLRFCVVNGAELRNKRGYPVAYFKGKADAEKICKMINNQYEVFKKELLHS